MDNLIFAWNIAKAALGLGFVIFLHELGHFLLAKWNGVKVERFSIGFGPTLASFRRGVGLRVGTGSRAPGPNDPPTWGETEYVLAALPLGGYVKMLGENGEEATEEAAAKTPDPRSYGSKSVWARMQIITAGVIMNVILGLACFTYVSSRGGPEQPALVGLVVAGSPAYRAGLKVQDEIVAIDGRRDVGYKDLLSKVSLSGAGQKIKFSIKRVGSEAEQVYEIEPLRDASSLMPTIGIRSALGLELFPKPNGPFQALPGQEVPPDGLKPGFEGEDKVVAIGPEGGSLEKVEDYVDYARKAEALRAVPMVVEVERARTETAKETTRAKVTVPQHRFLDFGFRLTPGPIVAVKPDSPAQRAGLKEGDKIVAVGGKADFDPMRLPDDSRASADRPMTLTLERAEGDGPPKTIEVTVTPDASPIWGDPFDPFGRLIPLDVPGLGLALAVEPKIQAVDDASPAARAGLKAGDSVRSVTLNLRKKDAEKSKPRPITVKLDGKVSGWPYAFNALQLVAVDSVEFTTDRTDKPVAIQPEVDPGRYHPMRGLNFLPMIREMPPLGLADAFNRGWEETVDNIFSIFRIFRGLAQGRVGGDAFGGVISIGQIAYSSASMGWTPFIHFLGILSINLAVLNFLPIPPLDGGQFTILAAEKVRGKPLSESLLNAVTIAGLVFVLGLILLVNGKDIFKLVQSYFF